MKKFIYNFKKTLLNKQSKTNFAFRFSRLSLRRRLSFLFVILLITSLTTVGVSSYFQAKNATIQTIENRLEREAEMMGYVAKNLKFLYISDDTYFKQQLEVSVRDQQKQLEKDGIVSSIYTISNKTVTPFKSSKDSSLSFSDTFINKVTQSDKAVFQEKISGEDYTISTLKLNEVNGQYLLVVPTESYLGAVTKMATFTIITVVVSIIISSIILSLFVKGLTKPLVRLTDIMRQVRDGNLVELSDSLQTKIPEIRSLDKSFHTMLTQMRMIIKEINETTNQLELTGGSLSCTSEDALEYSRQLIKAINVVKDGAEQTAISSESNVASYHAMKENVDKLLLNMNTVFKSSEDMNQSAIRGEQNNSILIEKTISFEKDFEHMTSTVKQVQHHSNSISNLVGLIKNIAEQTKLLSLNASIEAARAGEAGKGFAVVAQEVGKLAEESSKASKEISSSISEMEKVTFVATEEFDQMLQKIKTNLSSAHDSKESFDHLMKVISSLTVKLEDMKTELVEIKEGIPELEEATIRFASVSQETLASSEEMLATSENQIVQMESTYEAGMRLSELSKSLSQLSKRFKL
ncbi:methyl-accepting chemotaxis protein [Cytobacillus suaedae]|nr:methyl-accepting chemotaxis protein [Cytobacillus suaedae]